MTAPNLAQCASCGRQRGNSRTGWTPTIGRAGVVSGWSCPDCPNASEPIRRLAATGSQPVRFRVVIDATPPGSSQRRQITRTVPTLAAARALVAEVRTEVATGGALAAPAEAETIGALCARWLDSRRDVRTVTRQGYAHWLAPVVRHLGTLPVRELDVRRVETMIGWLSSEGGKLGQGLGARSVKGALTALSMAVDQAVREGTLPSNPVKLARRPRQRTVVGNDLTHWSPAELDAFRQVADQDALAGAWRLTLCGLTRADVHGLRWSDVDLAAGLVTIRQGRVVVDGGHATDIPKSAQRRRSVPVEMILPGTVAALRSLAARQAADRMAAGPAWQDSGLVLVDGLGRPSRPEVYSDRFRRLCRTAGVPVIRLHAVRHSLAFKLSGLGVVAADAASLLGHTTEVYLSTYQPERGATGIAAAAAALARSAAG